MLLSVMQVRVLPFGILKDWMGPESVAIELPEGATVEDLLERLSLLPRDPMPTGHSDVRIPKRWLRGIAVSVNAEYATTSHVLQQGDEVGLLPPVSGGCADENQGLTSLTRLPINANAILAASKQGDDGAVVVFDGIVRNNTRGRETLHLDYEAYEVMAVKQMDALADEARARFAVRHVTMIHRLGRLMVGETSVLIVVASAHRGAGFRRVSMAYRHAEEDGAHLEEGNVCGRCGVGGGRTISRWPGDGTGGRA